MTSLVFIFLYVFRLTYFLVLIIASKVYISINVKVSLPEIKRDSEVPCSWSPVIGCLILIN